MAYILHLETATKNCSVSISNNGELINCQEIAEENYTHAEKLHLFIAEIMKKEKLEFKQLSAIAVSEGPGSYTGLRIGVSSAKGLCYSLNVPLIAIDTLEILARNITIQNNELIIPMIDARRMECYIAVFDENYKKQQNTIAQIIDENSFSEIDKTIHFVGDGVSKCIDVLQNKKFIFHHELAYPSSKNMVITAYHKYVQKDFVDVAYFEPFYLKEFLLSN